MKSVNNDYKFKLCPTYMRRIEMLKLKPQ